MCLHPLSALSLSLVHTKTHDKRDFCHQEHVNLKMNAFCFSVDT